MKLTDLAIDGIGVCNNVNFSRLNSGLNLIYGENGSGKSTIRQFIRGVLFGYQGPFWNNFLSQATTGKFSGRGGQLNAVTAEGNFLLTRTLQPNSPIQVQSLSGASVAPEAQLLGNVTADNFDAFYNVDLQNRIDQAFRAAAQLQTRLGVPTGQSRWTSTQEYQAWKVQADARATRLETVRRDLAAANAERARLSREIENVRTSYTTRVQTLDVEIENASQAASMRATTIRGHREQIEALNRQIAELQAQLSNAPTGVQYVASGQPQPDRLAPLYQRLDEIDNQIGRWRRVQTDIQNQRIRLRDEMVVWNDLSLESEEHPYFRAREILVSLESRLDDVENQARHLESLAQAPTDPSQHARNIVAGCSEMRENLYGLCQELGSQYKHIRHKAAVAELKQLRRCYNEMGENVKRLVTRRENTIAEIRQLDPAGADAIMRAENQFCECARHEGFLEARRRFVGNVPATQQVDYTVVHPDLTAQRERLNQLTLQREQLTSQLPAMEVELRDREAQKARLIAEREQLRIGSASELEFKVAQLDKTIQQLNAELQSLQLSVEEDRRMSGTAPHGLITLASRYLQQMSEGDLNKVWLTNDESRIQITDRRGANIPIATLGPGDQHLVTLSLCLAGASGVRAQVPILLDDVFANIDSSRAIATAGLLNELGSQGQQFLAFTCHRAVMDRVATSRAGVFTTFELPQTTVAPAPVVYPDRVPYTPPTPPNDFLTTSQHPPTFTQPPALETYPYIKYPVANNPVGDMANFPRHDQRERQIEQEIQAPAVYRAPVQRMVSQPVAQVSAPVQYSIQSFSEDTPLRNFGFASSNAIQRLSSVGIMNASQLLALNPDALPEAVLQSGFTPDQFDRWQAETWMLICVPGMNYADAQVLVASGILEPEQLDTTPYEQLVGRVTRYLNSNEGRRYSSNYVFDQSSVNRWYDSLRSTRNNWRRDSGYSRRHRRRSQRSPREFEPRQEFIRSDRDSNSQPRMSLRSSFDGRDSQTVNSKTTKKSTKAKKNKTSSTQAPKMKFYLDMTDHVEAAPSIGPRTAERFEKIGVITIADFLRQTAESMASKIDYKRITADVVRQWQNQTRLVCRIPNLRGHDAQLLVACGITEPEDLASMSPDKVFGIVGPFSETKEGLKIIRSGKKPDLAEVKDWINWATNHRNLQAA